jgi:hypothetical protein
MPARDHLFCSIHFISTPLHATHMHMVARRELSRPLAALFPNSSASVAVSAAPSTNNSNAVNVSLTLTHRARPATSSGAHNVTSATLVQLLRVSEGGGRGTTFPHSITGPLPQVS